jgi:hypothetical protein
MKILSTIGPLLEHLIYKPTHTAAIRLRSNTHIDMLFPKQIAHVVVLAELLLFHPISMYSPRIVHPYFYFNHKLLQRILRKTMGRGSFIESSLCVVMFVFIKSYLACLTSAFSFTWFEICK